MTDELRVGSAALEGAERLAERAERALFGQFGRWAGYVAALAAVGLVSLLIGLVLGEVRIANISMLYLIAVLAAAVRFGRGPAVLASVAAFLTFDFFFTEPVHTFTVADPEEWVSLLLFLLTAVIAGQLAADQRQRAQEAQQREHEAVVLYDLVRLLAEPDLQAAVRAMAERLRLELDLAGVGIDCAVGGPSSIRAEVGDNNAVSLLRDAQGRSRHVFGEGQAPTALERGAPGRWVRVLPPGPPGRRGAGEADRLRMVPVKTGAGERVGAMYFVSNPAARPLSPSANRLLSTAAAQLGQAVERANLPRSYRGRDPAPRRRAQDRPAQRRLARPADATGLDCRLRRQPAPAGRRLDGRGAASLRPGHCRRGAPAQPDRRKPAGPVADRGRNAPAEYGLVRRCGAGRRRAGAPPATYCRAPGGRQRARRPASGSHGLCDDRPGADEPRRECRQVHTARY